MTPIPPLITYFLREYLPKERGFAQNTCETYAYAFQLFLEFASTKLKVRPSDLQLEQLDSKMVLDFLSDIEKKRGNSPSTRNSRLAAIKAFMKFVVFKIPSSIEQVRQIQCPCPPLVNFPKTGGICLKLRPFSWYFQEFDLVALQGKIPS